MRHSLRLTVTAAAAGGLLALTTLGGAVFAASSAPSAPAATVTSAANPVCAPEAAAVHASATVATLRALGDCEIGRRLTTLSTLNAKVAGSKVLTDDHRATLKSELAATTGGLGELKAKIDAETSIPVLRADVRRIVTEYRVYVLVARQVHLVNAADGVAAAGQKLTTVSGKLGDRIAAAEAAGKDVTKARADLAAMDAAIARATSLAAPLPARLLPLTPAQFNAGTAGPILGAARADLLSARSSLLEARNDAKAVVADLK